MDRGVRGGQGGGGCGVGAGGEAEEVMEGEGGSGSAAGWRLVVRRPRDTVSGWRSVCGMWAVGMIGGGGLEGFGSMDW